MWKRAHSHRGEEKNVALIGRTVGLEKKKNPGSNVFHLDGAKRDAQPEVLTGDWYEA